MAVILFALLAAVRRAAARRRDWAPNVHGENAYQILGVGPRAAPVAIRDAFRKLQRRHHPDAAPDERRAEAAATFVQISHAYELLIDPEARFQYDGMLDARDGRAPAFEAAYEQITNDLKHPAYALYDALVAAERGVAAGREFVEPAAEARAEPAPPVEVDIPDSIREAMGLPPLPKDGGAP